MLGIVVGGLTELFFVHFVIGLEVLGRQFAHHGMVIWELWLLLLLDVRWLAVVSLWPGYRVHVLDGIVIGRMDVVVRVD